MVTNTYPGAAGDYGGGNGPDDGTKQQDDEDRVCGCAKKKCLTGWLIACIAIVIIGIFLLALVPFLIDEKIRAGFSLANPQAPLYKTFVNATEQGVEVTNIYYFFNVSNAAAVEQHGAKPVVTSHGPYVYRHVKWRPESNIRWFANATMHYKSLIRNTFMPELSVGKESDRFVTPRAGLFGALQKVAAQPFLSGVFAEAVDHAQKHGEKISFFHERSVGELIHGYNETVIYWMQKLTADLDKIADLAPLDYMIGYDADALDLDKQKFMGIYSGGLHSKTQPKPPKNSFASYTMVDGESQLSFWNSTEANTIRGTDATYYPPFIMLDKTRKLYAYVSDISRSIDLVFDRKTTNFGIKVNRYRLDPQLLEPCDKVPANCDFFIYDQGIQPATPVKHNKREHIFAGISKWYFLGVTDKKAINVSMPVGNESTDDIWLDYEPLTSALVEANKRLQVNFRLRKDIVLTCLNKDLKGTVPWLLNASKNLPETWIPAFATNEHGTLPEKDRNTLKGLLGLLLAMLVLGILFVAAGTIVALLLGLLLWKHAQAEKDKPQRVAVQYGSFASEGQRLNSNQAMGHHQQEYGATSSGGGVNRSTAHGV